MAIPFGELSLGNELQRPVTTKDMYLEIVGKQIMPKTPKELPSSLNIPRLALGDLTKALSLGITSKKEWSQNIFYSNAKWTVGDLREGDENNPGGAPSFMKNFRAVFGEKALVQCHIHPNGTWYFSVADVRLLRGFPRGAFIDIAASVNGISASVQTQQSERLPISSLYRILATQRKLTKENFYESAETMARLLEEYGYGYYFHSLTPDALNSDKLDSLESVRFFKVTT